MKDANRSTQLKESLKHKERDQDVGEVSQGSPQTGKHEGDARGREEEKLPENREKLGVDEDHRNDTMQRGNRGTFP